MNSIFRKSGLSCALASVLVLSACSTGGSYSNAGSEADRLADLDRRAAELDAREQALNARAGVLLTVLNCQATRHLAVTFCLLMRRRANVMREFG